MISVGIDISKDKSTVCMLRPYGEVVEAPYSIAHTEQALNALIEHITSFDEDIRVVLEATGGYHQVVVSKLLSADIFTVVVNPYIMKKYCAATLRKAKTDKIDSVRIANYGIDHWFSMTAYCPPDEVYEELKLLGRQYEQYVRLKVSCKIQLANLLDGVMPGIKTILQGTVPAYSTKDKLCDFVEKYWHYDNIRRMSEKQFLSDYAKWTKKKGYRYNESQAIAIYQLSKNNIPTLKSSTPSTKMLVLQAVKSVRDAEFTLSLIISQMQEIASALPEYSVVRNMKVVGDVLSVRLIAEIGDVRRFRNGSALVAFAGIDAPPFESGKFVGTKRNISKRGSSTLRKIGYEIMHSLKVVKPTEDSAVYDFIIKKESEGKPKRVAKIAGLNKFLRIYYARVMEIYC
ncbi:MAG: IS110 family transposase [Ruminococcaceae bacterium]|nr:IS110 family transposase [Oscillospiraceae bacterium]